jgi:Flp pilus assembly protein TadD
LPFSYQLEMECVLVTRKQLMWTGLAGAMTATAGLVGWIMSETVLALPTAAAASGSPQTAAQSQALLQSGIEKGKAGDGAAASSAFERALELAPDDKLAWYDLGVLAAQDDKSDEARADYDRALAIDPSFASALYNKAVMLEAGAPDQAIPLFRRAIAANPKASTAYLHLGWALAKQGHADDATSALDHAVALDPSLKTLAQQPSAASAVLSPSTTPGGTG